MNEKRKKKKSTIKGKLKIKRESAAETKYVQIEFNHKLQHCFDFICFLTKANNP